MRPAQTTHASRTAHNIWSRALRSHISISLIWRLGMRKIINFIHYHTLWQNNRLIIDFIPFLILPYYATGLTPTCGADCIPRRSPGLRQCVLHISETLAASRNARSRETQICIYFVFEFTSTINCGSVFMCEGVFSA